MKRIDNEEFKKMWLNVEITPKEIADHFGRTRGCIHQKRIALGLAPKGTKGFGMTQHMKRKGERSAQRILKFLKNKDGFWSFQGLQSQFSLSAIEQLKHQGRLFVVRFNLGRSSGTNAMRKKQNLIFQEPYIGKSFVCDSRTAVIRLMFQALKKAETGQIQKTVTNFLRRYLSDAERLAVVWKLGKRKWERSQVKSSIQIDGIVKPRNLCPHCKQPIS
jgi:hypothetical protein